MTSIDLSRATWRKSSYSSQNGACIEAADNLPGTVVVRDSKDPQGPVLGFSDHDWRAFVRQIKDE
jgi:Domain of unknown function (DUF397)